IHPLSSIHSDAQIAPGVRIGPFTTIHKDVVIDEGTVIGSNAVIQEGARIGKHCQIFPGAVIASAPQDLKFEGEYTTCEIGDYTVVREYATVNRGTSESGRTVVGRHALLMAYSHVAHDCVLGDHVILANACNLAGHVIIDEYARLGGMCAVHQFVRIGRNVMVQGGSLIMKDVPPYVLAGRRPMRYLGVNSIGLKRLGMNGPEINHIQNIYRMVYGSGNAGNGLKRVESDIPETAIRDEILTWVRNSQRGILRGYGNIEDD
ncbi:UNVERIFIED_CONTAM: hypothetical protein GTU68_029180, partial [Idotea baltica]|nr:hypothetical protein [Idotea baltica]